MSTGKPELLYYVPEIFGGRDYDYRVDLGDVEVCLDLYSSRKKMYSEDIEELTYLLLPQHERPTNADQAYILYRDLLHEIEIFAWTLFSCYYSQHEHLLARF